MKYHRLLDADRDARIARSAPTPGATVTVSMYTADARGSQLNLTSPQKSTKLKTPVCTWRRAIAVREKNRQIGHLGARAGAHRVDGEIRDEQQHRVRVAAEHAPQRGAGPAPSESRQGSDCRQLRAGDLLLAPEGEEPRGEARDSGGLGDRGERDPAKLHAGDRSFAELGGNSERHWHMPGDDR